MERLSTTLQAVAVAAVIGAALSGCSSGGDEQPDISGPVTAAVETLQNAFSAGDMRALCRKLTEPGQREAGAVGHGQPTVYCEQDVRRALRIIEGGSGLSKTQPTVERVAGHADRATATLGQASRNWKTDVPLVKEAGHWKLAGFIGTDPAEVERIERTALSRPFPSPKGRPVEVNDTTGNPCPDLDDASYPAIAGGCSFVIHAKILPIRILTAFGDFKFGDCGVRYRVSVDASGRTWTDRWAIIDTKETSGCSDIDACEADSFERHPWKGRISKEGAGYVHHMDLCLRTCVGPFAGELKMRMTPTPDGWRVSQVAEDRTGLRIVGELEVRRGTFMPNP